MMTTWCFIFRVSFWIFHVRLCFWCFSLCNSFFISSLCHSHLLICRSQLVVYDLHFHSSFIAVALSFFHVVNVSCVCDRSVGYCCEGRHRGGGCGDGWSSGCGGCAGEWLPGTRQHCFLVGSQPRMFDVTSPTMSFPCFHSHNKCDAMGDGFKLI